MDGSMAGRGWRGGVAALALALAAAGPVVAVNKCVGADGSVTYTDGPCSGGSRVTRVDTPPPLSRQEQMEALSRSDSLVREARALEARQAAERQRNEELRQTELLRQRQAEREESERQARMAAVPMYYAPIYPVYPRHRPPVVVPRAPRPAPAAPPALMRSYPFR